MTCELWRDQIEGYIDGELASSHDAEVSDHLRGCGECNAYAAEAIHLKRGIATAGRRYQPTAEFRQKIVDSLGAGEKSRWRLPWFSFATAATLLVVLAVGLLMWRSRNADITREIADIHLNTLASANPVDVISTDMHTVKPWFQGRVPFTFNLPELAGSPFTLTGGRVVYVRGTPCAQLLFQYRLHRISMLIGPENVLATATERNLPNGFHLLHFEKSGYTYMTIGDAGVDTLSDLEQRMRAVQN
jgi:anti-sigma factor RsiW